MAHTMLSKTNGIKKGTTIIIAEPFTFVLSSQHRTERCDYCFCSGKLSRCSGCQYVYYCSKNCQRRGWITHKVECPNIKRVQPRVIPDAGRMMAKIIIKLHQGGADERGYYTPTKYRTFYDMMSHVSNIQEDVNKMHHFTSLSMVLFEFLPNDILPGPKELLEIFGRITVNSFHILDNDLSSLGVGIYLGPSIIDHSCKPNATAIFEGTTLIIRTLCDLPTLDWTKVFIPYTDPLQDPKTRRDELMQSYYFWCDCERCETPDTLQTAAACPNKTCTNPCLPTDINCSKCGEKFPSGFKDEFDTICLLSTYQLERMAKTANLDVSRMCLERQQGILHSYHYLVVRMLEMAVTATIESERWHEAENFVSQLVSRYVYYYGETHPMVGQVYFSWGKLLSFQMKNAQAFEVVSKAAEIIKIAFGENHSKMRTEVKPFLDQLMAENHVAQKMNK